MMWLIGDNVYYVMCLLLDAFAIVGFKIHDIVVIATTTLRLHGIIAFTLRLQQ